MRWCLFMALLTAWTMFNTNWFIPTFLPDFWTGMIIYWAGIPGCVCVVRKVYP